MRFLVPSRAEPHDDCAGWVPDMETRSYLAEIKYMDPADFLRLADPSFEPRKPNTLKYLMEIVRTGGCFAPLELWPNRRRSWGMKHEGRHRAWLARELGMKSVPVYVWMN
jgi:hypothetical protein